MRVEGTLVKWDDERGFGFIRPVDGGKDIFVHITSFPRATGRPDVGEQVSYEIEESDRGPRAAQVMSLRTIKSEARSSRSELEGESLSWRKLSWSEVMLVSVFFGVILALAAVGLVPSLVPLIYAGVSCATFLLFWADKQSALNGGWRVNEKTLLGISFCGGWPGGLIAQHLFRHKTSKDSFRLMFILTVVGNLIALARVCVIYAGNTPSVSS